MSQSVGRDKRQETGVEDKGRASRGRGGRELEC